MIFPKRTTTISLPAGGRISGISNSLPPKHDFGNPENATQAEPPITAVEGLPAHVKKALEELKQLERDPRRELLVRDKGVALLLPGFEVCKAIEEDPSIFDDVAEALGSEKMPNRKHFWTMPLNAVCKPSTLAEQKRVSDLACYIRAGLIKKVSAEDFVAWAEEMGITRCIKLARTQSDIPSPRSNEEAVTAPSGETLPVEVPELSGDDPQSVGGVRISLKVHDTESRQLSGFVTRASAARLSKWMDVNEKPDALDLIYAAADAIEGRPWPDVLDRLARQAGYVRPHELRDTDSNGEA